ncbi:MAG: hypothetical protein LBT05_06575 [Planctomycetaceae bacterium]|nr:hypothetical protein [Planctomycetaceae bacterium]
MAKNNTPAIESNIQATFEETKKIENEIKSYFFNSKKIEFTFFPSPNLEKKTIIISDKKVLEEFANKFRFNKPLIIRHIPKNQTPSLIISVNIKFSEEKSYRVFASLPNIHSLYIANNDDTIWYEADMSIDIILLYNYYFSKILKEWNNSGMPYYSIDDYEKNYYSWSFLK